MILTDDDLEAFTHRKQSAAQARVLAAMGVDFKRRPDGTIIVSEQVVAQFLGEVANPKVKNVEPNWNSINA
jgi:Domain of unknown function (DUF4224)